MGYRYLETDVHATADGMLLAFHDLRLDRVTDQRGVIADLPMPRCEAARINGTEPIPLLSDLLEEFPDTRINIDVKAPGAIEPLAEVIRAHTAIDRVCVGSFSDRRLRAVRRLLGPRSGHRDRTGRGGRPAPGPAPGRRRGCAPPPPSCRSRPGTSSAVAASTW